MRSLRPRHRLAAPLAGLALLALTAGVTASVTAAGGADHAGARLIDSAGQTIGWARLTEDASGQLHLNVQVAGLAPGRHGVHLHAIGQCAGPAFASAGGHHNPLGAEHGLDNPAGAHAGDLPNLTVNGAGRGHLDAVSHHATLSTGPVSLFDADGSAIVIHANEDDQVTNPTGNSGARIACGVIEAG
jgi:Cu-Zn family superoxide dismutase